MDSVCVFVPVSGHFVLFITPTNVIIFLFIVNVKTVVRSKRSHFIWTQFCYFFFFVHKRLLTLISSEVYPDMLGLSSPSEINTAAMQASAERCHLCVSFRFGSVSVNKSLLWLMLTLLTAFLKEWVILTPARFLPLCLFSLSEGQKLRLRGSRALPFCALTVGCEEVLHGYSCYSI